MRRSSGYDEAAARIGQARATRASELNLSRLWLREVPDSLATLTSLRVLNLRENQLSKLPDWLASLTNLQSLDLSKNQLSRMSDWLGSLTNLQSLNLSGNQLIELPDSLGSLTRLHSLDLSGNLINPELRAVYDNGFDALQVYLRVRRDKQIVLNEAKLILIGEGEVGKSCL